MASKVTPLYAETRVLLNLWALDETPATKSKFQPGTAYKEALKRLEEENAFEVTWRNKSTKAYSLASSGKIRLAENLANEDFCFHSNIGKDTTNALLSWIRINLSANEFLKKTSDVVAQSAEKPAQISSYEAFEETALKAYDQLNQDYNLDDLVPIYRIRREIGDRLPRQKFNEWLLEVQANDLVQLMGSDLSNVTPDQMEDSLTIPGAGARFFVKRLS